MKKAIITGSTGLVGSALASYLFKKGIDILCLGRRHLSASEKVSLFGSDQIPYLVLGMEDILSLPEEIERINWTTGESCVFYNFAWGGIDRLTDGEFKDQFINVTYCANAVLSAKRLRCQKFVNSGTVEESFVEAFLREKDKGGTYNSTQSSYALSKLAARDMCKMVAYLEKIDYIHTRLSVPLDSGLTKGGYVRSVLLKIKEGRAYERPKNNQFFDIILLEDVVHAYYLIGLKGKNKSDYFIGTSQYRTLNQYFELFENYKKGNYFREGKEKSSFEKNEIFSIEDLVRDTGFSLSVSFDAFMEAAI
jgi:nucleoside-diphosphate-sugar epimerase